MYVLIGVLAALIILALVVFVIRRRRRRQPVAAHRADESETDEPVGSESEAPASDSLDLLDDVTE
jgi:flagellar biosynthesis/type III secretory pathway M-ring protein FliF/YscJ